MLRYTRTLTRPLAMLVVTVGLAGGALKAQTPAADPSARLKEVLPADVAERVLAQIAEARARGLPAEALEHRALKFAAKGVEPTSIEKSVTQQADRMQKAKDALEQASGRKPAGDEVEAGAEAIRKGVDGAKVSELAKSAPSGRSLAVPLYVVGSLVDRGLPSDEALERVLERLQARAADAELEKLTAELPEQGVAGQSHRPAQAGRDLAATKRPGSAGGPPAAVPANAGKGARPAGAGQGHRP
jgi:hypothetical protein